MGLARSWFVFGTRKLQGIVALGLLAACAGETENVREVEDAIASVQAEDRSYIEYTQEEFVVAMEKRLEAYETILRGVEDRRAGGGLSSEDVTALNEGVADVAERILEIKTTLDPSWIEGRGPLIQRVNALQRRLIAAWHEVR